MRRGFVVWQRECGPPHVGLGVGAGRIVARGRCASLRHGPCGMARQTLHDWVHRYNADGLAGLSNRHGGGIPCLLSAEQEQVISGWIVEGPELARDGVTRWRRADLVRAIKAHFGVVMAERSISDVLRRLGFRRLVLRPRYSGHDGAAPAFFRPTSPSS